MGPEPLHPFPLACFAGSTWHEGLPRSSRSCCKYLWFPGPPEKLSEGTQCSNTILLLCLQEAGQARRGNFHCPLLSPSEYLVGTVDSHHRMPWNWPALPALPPVLPRGGPQGCTCVSLPHRCYVLHKGSRLPWAGVLGFWVVVSTARKACGNLARSLHAPVTPVPTGARG